MKMNDLKFQKVHTAVVLRKPNACFVIATLEHIVLI